MELIKQNKATPSGKAGRPRGKGILPGMAD
jgi:hypothetical protein